MKTTKDKVTVKVNIRPGPVSPAARASWNKWWAARIAEVKSEALK